jgi:hypothetical protein
MPAPMGADEARIRQVNDLRGGIVLGRKEARADRRQHRRSRALGPCGRDPDRAREDDGDERGERGEQRHAVVMVADAPRRRGVADGRNISMCWRSVAIASTERSAPVMS